MSFSSISAISPLDGRYASKLAALRPLMSEQGYMHRRVQVEVAWLIALSDAGFTEFKPLTGGARTYLNGLVKNFSEADGLAIKEIEKTTNHDVKAVEYWIKSKFEARPELLKIAEFVHFACTSEDINNTSHALQLKGARDQVLLPALDAVLAKLRQMAQTFAAVPMLSRTHGQTASPTTVGKEVANVVVRLQAARDKIAVIPLLAKMNGAVATTTPTFRPGRTLTGRRSPGASLKPKSPKAWAWPFRPTASRSSRTITWPSCLTPWRGLTPS